MYLVPIYWIIDNSSLRLLEKNGEKREHGKEAIERGGFMVTK